SPARPWYSRARSAGQVFARRWGMRVHLGAGLLAALLAGLVPAAGAERSAEWVRQRARQVKDSDTTAWKRLPWGASRGQAQRAAGDERRPVFLFPQEGNIETGRC